MKTWLITYTYNKKDTEVVLLDALSYTMALVDFMIKYPEAEYTGIYEVIKSESAFA